ncbi:hypothetical protein GIB67_030307 [Kingdonia uniflora]|uniref:Uncharacterized protein n=1 Tax=Kingdonia uniflora TaxID=39325 RepID=A0A7J7M6L0_9MAGN|nr:hypothetical protein GIB67_030307 [Kingdonia uniflora]
MGIGRNSVTFVPLVIILYFITLHSCTAIEIIRDPETVISSGGAFKLGFFSPGNSSNRYVGIWYNKIPQQTVVWVANRANPVSDSSGVLMIDNDGNLAIVDGKRRNLWTSNVTDIAYNTTVELLDSGNLVLQEVNSSGRIVWESFKYPSHTLLPTMKIGVNPKLGEKLKLTSWKSNSDPSIGDFSLELDSVSIPQVITWNGSKRHWRTGPWNNQIFIGVRNMYSVYLDGFSLIRDVEQKGSIYITYNYVNTSSSERFFLDPEGTLIDELWNEVEKEWVQRWLGPRKECDIYGTCGPFGVCNILNSPICSCLKGFEPKSIKEWSMGNWSSGCARRTELQCGRNNTNNEKEKEDGFLKLQTMKVPDFANWVSGFNFKDCQEECTKNCSCIALSFPSGIGCMLWSEDLLDIQKFSNAGVDLYIRVAHTEIDKKKDARLIIIITVLLGVFSISYLGCLLWRWMTQKREKKIKYNGNLHIDRANFTSIAYPDPHKLGENPDLTNFQYQEASNCNTQL